MMAWLKWQQHASHHHGEEHAGHEGHGRHGHHHGRGRGPCGPWGDGDPREALRDHLHAAHDGFDADGGSFGVRRPLRFLAQRLELDEKQVEGLAQILNELKTERAQAAVDHRRTVAGFADIIAGEAFDGDKAGVVATDRVKSAEKMRDALVRALGAIHALLRADQRATFAYLIRTGALTL